MPLDDAKAHLGYAMGTLDRAAQRRKAHGDTTSSSVAGKGALVEAHHHVGVHALHAGSLRVSSMRRPSTGTEEYPAFPHLAQGQT